MPRSLLALDRNSTRGAVSVTLAQRAARLRQVAVDRSGSEHGAIRRADASRAVPARDGAAQAGTSAGDVEEVRLVTVRKARVVGRATDAVARVHTGDERARRAGATDDDEAAVIRVEHRDAAIR